MWMQILTLVWCIQPIIQLKQQHLESDLFHTRHLEWTLFHLRCFESNKTASVVCGLWASSTSCFSPPEPLWGLLLSHIPVMNIWTGQHLVGIQERTQRMCHMFRLQGTKQFLAHVQWGKKDNVNIVTQDLKRNQQKSCTRWRCGDQSLIRAIKLLDKENKLLFKVPAECHDSAEQWRPALLCVFDPLCEFEGIFTPIAGLLWYE